MNILAQFSLKIWSTYKLRCLVYVTNCILLKWDPLSVHELLVYGTNHETGNNLFAVAYLAVFSVPQNNRIDRGTMV